MKSNSKCWFIIVPAGDTVYYVHNKVNDDIFMVDLDKLNASDQPVSEAEKYDIDPSE